MVRFHSHLGQTNFPEAESLIRAAILHHEQLGMKWDLAYDYLASSQFLKLQGREAEEKEDLRKAALLFEACGAEEWSRKILPAPLEQIEPPS
jgi:hypothetical protein